MPRSKWILTLIGASVLVIIGWRLFGGSNSADFRGGDLDAPVPVTVVTAESRNVPVYLTNQGTVSPINIVNVQPQASGQLLSLGFTEGGTVKRGQVLARIDARSVQAQLDQALAKRAQDRTQLATAKANLERLDNPKYAPYVAQIDRITQENTVAQWQAAVAADDASIENTRVQLGFTQVRSPIEGVAGIRQVAPGNVINPQSTIVTVTQMHPIEVVFTLAGKYLDAVRTAQTKTPLKVAILDADGNVVESDGLLKVIDNQIDPGTGSFKLKAEFPNAGNQLFPGQFANTRLQVGVDTNSLVVPSAAVQRGPSGEYVWKLTGQAPQPTHGGGAANGAAKAAAAKPRGKSAAAPAADAQPAHYVVMQTVSVGGEAADNGLIVTAGLQAGDRVVTAGQFRLKQGSKVTPLKPGEIPAPPTTTAIKNKAPGGGGRRH